MSNAIVDHRANGGNMGRFLVGAKTVTKPEDVIPFLAKKERHWKTGFSAKELAQSWFAAGGFPPRVRAVLAASPKWRNASFVEGLFEYEVDLRTDGNNSQTDLMVTALLAGEPAVIAVEGKVKEHFGDVVSVWNISPTKDKRLNDLCARLDLDPAHASKLRYQLLHRCVSALLEAEAIGAKQALMLVHSFSSEDASLTDFLDFAEAVGFHGAGRDAISESKRFKGIDLSLGWAADRPAV